MLGGEAEKAHDTRNATSCVKVVNENVATWMKWDDDFVHMMRTVHGQAVGKDAVGFAGGTKVSSVQAPSSSTCVVACPLSSDNPNRARV